MKKHKKQGGMIFDRCLSLCCISPSSVTMSKALFDTYGAFDESLPACEDYDLWLRICAHEEVLFLETPLIEKYGGHDDQLSRAFWGMDRFRIQALEKLLAETNLTSNQRRAALETLVKKLDILVGGARKRDNQDAMVRYTPKLVHWSAALDEDPGVCS